MASSSPLRLQGLRYRPEELSRGPGSAEEKTVIDTGVVHNLICNSYYLRAPPEGPPLLTMSAIPYKCVCILGGSES